MHFDFTKMYPRENGYENVLILMNTFSKFSVLVVTPYQQANCPRGLNRWCYTCGIPLGYIITKERVLIMTSLSRFVSCMV